MATDLTTGPAPAPSPIATSPAPPAEPLHAERAATGLALRQIWIGGLVVVISLGLLLWAGTTAYRKSAEAGGGLMTALASNPAVRAIYGLPTAITTIGGFAVWRVELFVMLLGAVWMTLATTRVVRGDEVWSVCGLPSSAPGALDRVAGGVGRGAALPHADEGSFMRARPGVGRGWWSRPGEDRCLPVGGARRRVPLRCRWMGRWWARPRVLVLRAGAGARSWRCGVAGPGRPG